MNFQDAPAGPGSTPHGNARKFRDNRTLVARARDGEEGTLRRPSGNGRVRGKPGNGEALGQQAEFQMTSRGGHGVLGQTPHGTTVHVGALVFRVCAIKKVRRRTTGIGNGDSSAAESSFDGGGEGSNCR